MAIRKRASSLTTAEKNRYVNVITQLINDGTYGDLVSAHSEDHDQHSGMGGQSRQRFLAWHRVYLLRLEEEMQKIDPDAFIPYWKWTAQRSIPAFLRNFMPNVNVPGMGLIQVERIVGAPPPLPTKRDINDALSESDFTAFTTALEGWHGDVHVWVGGTMADIMVSPADPLFWLHHAQIDRLWARWQAKHPGENPSLTGSARTMDPWSEREADIRSISSLGYSYQATTAP